MEKSASASLRSAQDDRRRLADSGFRLRDGILGALYLFVSNGNARTQKEIPLTPETERRLDEVKHHLAENEAQRNEVTGYINQLSIQLHRWQLRLQKLHERKAQLEADLSVGSGSDSLRGNNA
jgi:hypothetical protein